MLKEEFDEAFEEIESLKEIELDHGLPSHHSKVLTAKYLVGKQRFLLQ